MPTLVRHREWTIDRIVPLLAATMVLLGTVLAATVSPWWLILTALVGANLLLYGVVGWCPATLIMTRLGVPAGRTGPPRVNPRSNHHPTHTGSEEIR
ncbi:YgaP family membrane protein [Nocardia sp. X0981]